MAPVTRSRLFFASEGLPSARSRFLGVTELVERTLLNLTFRQLFILRGVSPIFEQVIEGSVLLKRNMWLASPIAINGPFKGGDKSKTRLNPFLSETLELSRYGKAQLHFVYHVNDEYHISCCLTADPHNFTTDRILTSWRQTQLTWDGSPVCFNLTCFGCDNTSFSMHGYQRLGDLEDVLHTFMPRARFKAVKKSFNHRRGEDWRYEYDSLGAIRKLELRGASSVEVADFLRMSKAERRPKQQVDEDYVDSDEDRLELTV